MKIITKLMITGVAGIFSLAFQLSAQAAPLNLDIFFDDPTFTTDGTRIAYAYDESAANTGGVLTIGGSSVTTTMLEPDGTTSSIIGTVPGPTSPILGNEGDYLLTAIFDDNGNFVPAGSSISITGFSALPFGFGGTIANPFFAAVGGGSGTIITMDLVEFGFTGKETSDPESARDSVTFEWIGDIVGGDFFDLGYFGPVGGVIAAGNVFYGSTDGTTPGNFGGEWDPLEINDMTAFTADFGSCVTGCPLEVNTYVPVPAAVWLFGSGLVGLFGISRRRRVA